MEQIFKKSVLTIWSRDFWSDKTPLPEDDNTWEHSSKWEVPWDQSDLSRGHEIELMQCIKYLMQCLMQCIKYDFAVINIRFPIATSGGDAPGWWRCIATWGYSIDTAKKIVNRVALVFISSNKMNIIISYDISEVSWSVIHSSSYCIITYWNDIELFLMGSHSISLLYLSSGHDLLIC